MKDDVMERRTYHPIEHQETKHLLGTDMLCANSKEGLGYWCKFIGIDFESKYPYVCKLSYNNKIKSFKWIAIY